MRLSHDRGHEIGGYSGLGLHINRGSRVICSTDAYARI